MAWHLDNLDRTLDFGDLLTPATLAFTEEDYARMRLEQKTLSALLVKVEAAGYSKGYSDGMAAAETK